MAGTEVPAIVFLLNAQRAALYALRNQMRSPN